MAGNVRRVSLSEIFDDNSQYINDLTQQFDQQYGAEFEAILRLSEKYRCAFADIDPAQLDPEDVADYRKAQKR